MPCAKISIWGVHDTCILHVAGQEIATERNFVKKRFRHICGLLAQARDKVAIIEKQCERAATTRALKTADDVLP
jgi:RNase P protein component